MGCFTCILWNVSHHYLLYTHYFMCYQESKKHYQLIEGCQPGCIYWEAKGTYASRPYACTDPSMVPSGAPAMCSCDHMFFCKICKRYFNCNQTTVSFHSDFPSVTLPLVLGGTGVALCNLGIFLKGKLSQGYI